MKKILIIYYSGTGNTKYIVDHLFDYLNPFFDICIWNIFSQSTFNTNDFDYIILCYPIYAFNAPKPFDDFIKNLNVENKEYLIIKNSSEPLHLNDASSVYINKVLSKKNCLLQGEYHLLMPYHIIFRHKDSMVKQMLEYNEKYLEYIKNKIILGEKNIPKVKTKYKFVSFVGKLQRIGAKINPKLSKIDTNKCIKCNKCINECPVQAIIKKNEKLVLTTKCIMCMKCTSNCPTNAINFGILNKWKVNGDYNLKEIKESSLNSDYVSKASKRFQKVYAKYYEYLDEILKN